MREYGRLNLDLTTDPAVDQAELGAAYPGSMQQILSDNTGNFVRCEFLIGSNNIEVKEGILYSVGVSFIVLFEQSSNSYVVCDLYSIKFVTFFDIQGM